TATKRRLVQLMWNARQAGDHHTRAEIRRTYDRVTARIAREKRTLTPDEILARQYVRETPPLQLTREAAQRAQQEARRPELDAAAQQRTLARAAQNALAHAIWSTYTGDRTWEAIPTRPTTLQAHAPREEPSSSATGPARLTIRVPATPTTPAATLHLYRSDYQALLDLWGYGTVAHALNLTHQLRGAVPSAIREAEQLMMSAARHPNLARAWHSYITSPRLGDIYRWHEASRTLQLSPNRNGDLREAVEQLYRACRLTPSE
ncbi:hypothetical protein, partial [Deinococcus sp. 6GRE01]|uniref:hypothetical protein n=1 Tax=Deinococcus sp. 6GRE01 TaxID=2745873 RepID=UPI001E61C723